MLPGYVDKPGISACALVLALSPRILTSFQPKGAAAVLHPLSVYLQVRIPNAAAAVVRIMPVMNNNAKRITALLILKAFYFKIVLDKRYL
jgi:hypothetical protein